MHLPGTFNSLRKWLPLCLLGGAVNAAPLQVTVLDRDNQPVPDVAVYLQPTGAARSVALPGTTAIMDQIDTRFVPSLLVVQSGTSVEFPNTDTVAHHVYSFSHPNDFKLPLYKGNAHPPVSLESSGIVILGCNVHDNMLGYIVVVDTPLFSKTDKHGTANFDVSPGAVTTVSIWSPRFRDGPEALNKAMEVINDGNIPVTFKLAKTLRPPIDQQSDALSWSSY
ncbi:MAG: methylamine utilization protein [Gammaproteobacteria bacterium]|nr:methylamine utilization protein [Gammaproteobacteria bacterium]